jgi:hypothetical protein
VSISPVAFELTKRRTRRDFVQFFRDFNASRTRVRSESNSNFQATYAAVCKPSRILKLTTLAGEPALEWV